MQALLNISASPLSAVGGTVRLVLMRNISIPPQTWQLASGTGGGFGVVQVRPGA
jgi:hypothetical protein